jgi:hypothetical protein
MVFSSDYSQVYQLSFRDQNCVLFIPSCMRFTSFDYFVLVDVITETTFDNSVCYKAPHNIYKCPILSLLSLSLADIRTLTSDPSIYFFLQTGRPSFTPTRKNP